MAELSTPKSGSPALAPGSRRRILEISGSVLLLGLLVIVVFVFLGHPPKNQPRPLPATAVTSVPDSFTDFTGRIVNINGQVVELQFTGINSAGQQIQRLYNATITDKTSIQQADDQGHPTGTALALSDLRQNQTVIVTGDQNIAPLSTFTATSLTVIH